MVDDCVYAIFIDSNKHMWFGTHAGISRFDGTNWVTFTKENAGEGLSDNLVHSIFEDGQQRLWIGTDVAGAVKGAQNGRFESGSNNR